MSNSFIAFLKKFPEMQLPMILDAESAHVFSVENEPINQKMIDDFILPYELEELDDMTEYVACFRVAKTKDFHAIVYWRAGLMNYQYVLATFDLSGNPLDRRPLAGTYSDGKVVTNSIAKIDEDWTIYIISGQTDDGQVLYDAAKSKTIELELLTDGRIIDALD